VVEGADLSPYLVRVSASSDIGFGWRLSVASKYASGDQATGCVCNAPDNWQLQGFEIWRCKPE
jgi:hypothetical protein